MMTMDYKQEIDKILSDILREDWMDDEDYNEIIESLKASGVLDYDTLNNQVTIGVSNGYSIERQIEILRKVINLNK